MPRLLTCLLCLFGLAIPTVAQDAPAKPVKTRVKVRIVGEDKNDRKRDPKASRVGVTVDRPVVIERRIVVQSGAPGYRIGVQLAPVPPGLQAQLGLKPGQGLMVNSVIPGLPAAAKKKLKPFDILVGVNGKSPVNHELLTQAVQASGKQKKPVKLTVIRGGKKTTVEVTPAAETRTITDASLEEVEKALHGLEIEGAVNLDELKKRIRILAGGKDGQKRFELDFDSEGKDGKKGRGGKIEGSVNLDELKKKIRILAGGKDGQKRIELHIDSEGEDGQKRIELHIDSEGKGGKTGRFTRSIRISSEGVIVTPRQPATTQKPGQGDPQEAQPRFRLRFGRPNDDAPADPDSLSKKLEAALKRIEQLETTVKKLRKPADKKK